MSSAFDSAMALAALLCGDAGGAAAEDGLSPALGARLRERVTELESRMASGRARALSELAKEIRPLAAPTPDEPRRVLAVLATEVERARGQVWLASVPGHRPGWTAPAGLRALLVRATPGDREAREARELAELEASAWPA